MEIILINWSIKHECRDQFEDKWKSMILSSPPGFYREILTRADKNVSDPKYHALEIESSDYTTYINIGMWKSIDHFKKAVKKYFPETEPTELEFKKRERIALKKVLVREGSLELPEAELKE